MLAAILVLAAALRFTGLAAQSFWYDEAATVLVLRPGFADTMAAVPETEVTPPLYYVAAWLWTRVLGEGEAGVRSLSALAGVATVALVYLAGRRLHSHRAGLAAAALAAVNPMFVWYSQEARSYALMVCLSALGLLLWLRALERPDARRLAAWSAAGAAAVATHYFAVFLVAAEAAVLLRRRPVRRPRALAAALGPLALAGLALLPLAQAQRADGRASWIALEPLAERFDHVGRELLTANTAIVSSSSGFPPPGWGSLALVAVLGGIWAAVRRTDEGERAAARLAAGVGALALAVPYALAFTPLDYFKDRNVMSAWLPLMLALALGLTARRLHRRWRALGLGAVIAASLGVHAEVATKDRLQRSDWRAAVRSLGPPDPERALLVRPDYSLALLWVYGRAPRLPAPGSRVRELVVVGLEDEVAEEPPAPLTGFRPSGRRRFGDLRLLRFERPEPQTLDLPALERFTVPVRIDTPGPAPVP